MELNSNTQVCDHIDKETDATNLLPEGAWGSNKYSVASLKTTATHKAPAAHKQHPAKHTAKHPVAHATKTPVKQPAKPATTPSTPIVKQTINPDIYKFKYAPEVKPVQGTFDMSCIALKWLDNRGAELRRVNNMCTAVSKTYSRLSNRLVKLNEKAQEVSVNYKHTATNLPRAEDQAKRVVNASKPTKGRYDFYLIVNNGVKARSNAGGDTAHLLNTLTLTGNHELGHLSPFKLEHAGVLEHGKVVGSKDIYSFMTNYGSDLTSAQLRNLGWLPNKVAQYDVGTPQTDFPMEYLLTDMPKPGFVKAVRIPGSGIGKDLYLSIVQSKGKNIFALHQSYGANNDDGTSNDGGGGSIRVGLFGDHFTFKNLLFSKVATDGNRSVVRVATAPAVPAPSATKMAAR